LFKIIKVGNVGRYELKMDNLMNITNWVPAEEGLRQIIELLKESQSPDTGTQRVVHQVSLLTLLSEQFKSIIN
jgi:hypothetical protein